MREAAGFTLIEIVVAVAVLATALGAVIVGMTRHADNAGSLRDKTVALWVAHNRLAEIELQQAWPDIGRSDGDAEMAGADWRWFVEVSETPDPNVRRVDIRVQLDGQEQDLITLSSFRTQ